MKAKQTSIALDQDIISAVWDKCAILHERKKSKPSFSVGDVLAVKETWRWSKNFYGRIELMHDFINPSGQWVYSNNMPVEHAVRFLRVVSIEVISPEAYVRMCPDEIKYDKGIFSCDCRHLPYDRWFRLGIPTSPPTKDVFLVTYQPVNP